jgi:germination protein M
VNRFLTILSVALVVAACGTSSGDLGGVATPLPTAEPSIDAPSSEPTPGSTGSSDGSPSTTPNPSTSAGETTTVRAYFILGSFVDNAGLVPVLREVARTKAVGAAAVAALLAGPNDDELGARPAMYSDVPDGTRFFGLTIEEGVATVNLSKEFVSGGDSASMRGRVAQVVYTLTQFPSITSVRFQIDGQVLAIFSEGLGREDYRDQLPAIFVDRPAWGGVLGNPARIVGLANVFEATFRVEIVDGQGRALAAGPVTASCGSDCWGTFDVTVPYHVAAAGWGTLRVFEPSAKDGSPTNVTQYPVWLTP